MATGNESIVPEQELHDFVVRCMEAVGTNTEHADVLADLIVAADTRGHYSHGLNRLGKFRYCMIVKFNTSKTDIGCGLSNTSGQRTTKQHVHFLIHIYLN